MTSRFVGRADLLGRLRTALNGPRPVALYGLGGVGKTQLALAYLAATQHRYQLVWWVRAERQATMDSDLVALARALRLPEATAVEQQHSLAAVRAWLARNDGWLLILDNAEGDATLELLGPVGARGRLLLTSRNQLWRDAAVVWVHPWALEESVAFLRASLAEHPPAGFDQVVAERVAAELGHLPIALEQAVAYVRAAERPLAGYLELVRTRPQQVFALSELPDDQRTVAKTWASRWAGWPPTRSPWTRP
jgi:hypothetical protein